MAERPTSLVARVVALAAPDDGRAVQLGIVAPGTAGAGAVVDAVVDRLRSHEVPVRRVTGRRREVDHELGAVRDLLAAAARSGDPGEPGDPWAVRASVEDALRGAALVVDEAQWLDRASLRVVVAVAERAAERRLRVTVVHRPAGGDPDLAALDAALARSHPLVALGPLDEAGTAELAARVLGGAVDDRLVEVVHDQTVGLPGLVQLALSEWLATGVVAGGRLVAPPGRPGPALVAALAAEVDQLPSPARTVLAALSAGADLDDGLLGAVADIAPDDLGAAVDDLRAAGLVAPGSGEAIPLVAAAVAEMTPVAERRLFHARLAGALAHRGAPATRTGEHLAAAEAEGPAVAAAFAAAGDATLVEAPELAAGWYERAIAAGLDPAVVAARRAEAAALAGDPVGALRLADAVVAVPGAADRSRALAVVAALLPGRGFWARSSRAYLELAALGDERRAPAWAALSAIGAVATGSPPEAAGAPAGPAGGMEQEALRLTAEAVAASASDRDGADPLAAILEAAELIESAHTELVLPTSPHAVGATVALALCELTTAEHLLTRARDADVGGAPLRLLHRLGLGWVAVRSGRWAAAQAALDEAAGAGLAPREVLLAAAIEAGLARRSGDLARLGDAWSRAEGAVLRHPADLFSLEVVGELVIGAARLGLWERVAPKAHELGDVVRSLGEPPLWLLPLRWIGLQVALATDDADAALRRAAEVVDTAPVHPRLGALADAARTWVAVLGGSAEPGGVAAAAAGLQALGLTWEASRLTGQAAIRSADPSVTRSLLERARDLKAALPASGPDEAPTGVGVLSEREQMVAQYIVDGLTHKEIGAQLYISPKTVEHHVAKIRQKVGASTRAEMLAALRTHLST
ncbi:MAG TPA: helix-turn-helix transcriptional regulator [Acidimicrobiales bacterium]|nr:helix-turn-helix transcriptional regulator [Acidimicrobiales bacterium]